MADDARKCNLLKQNFTNMQAIIERDCQSVGNLRARSNAMQLTKSCGKAQPELHHGPDYQTLSHQQILWGVRSTVRQIFSGGDHCI